MTQIRKTQLTQQRFRLTLFGLDTDPIPHGTDLKALTRKGLQDQLNLGARDTRGKLTPDQRFQIRAGRHQRNPGPRAVGRAKQNIKPHLVQAACAQAAVSVQQARELRHHFQIFWAREMDHGIIAQGKFDKPRCRQLTRTRSSG